MLERSKFAEIVLKFIELQLASLRWKTENCLMQDIHVTFTSISPGERNGEPAWPGHPVVVVWRRNLFAVFLPSYTGHGNTLGTARHHNLPVLDHFEIRLLPFYRWRNWGGRKCGFRWLKRCWFNMYTVHVFI